MYDGFCFIRRAAILPDGSAHLDIKAVNNSFDWHWATSSPARGREMLTIALTAITTNRQIFCYITDTTANVLVIDGYFGLGV